VCSPAKKLKKNRTELKAWGVTSGGRFYGIASGVIAKPLAAVFGAVVIAMLGTATYFYSPQTPGALSPSVDKQPGSDSHTQDAPDCSASNAADDGKCGRTASP